jgi:uncharacterized protein (DUF362 family)
MSVELRAEQDTAERGLLNDPVVAISYIPGCAYPAAPFHPPPGLPELARLPFPIQTDATNRVYIAVREALRLLGQDTGRFGTREWNPLQNLVRPGNHVVIKPNWVKHKHERNESWEQIVTHGSVLRPVIDYVQLALEGKGRISLADGPMLDADFQKICLLTGLDKVKAYYDQLAGAVDIELLDLRSIRFETRDAVVVRRHSLRGDPRGGVAVNLGRHSALYRFKGEGRYYGADYDTKEVNQHHHGELHEYQLSGTAMEADVIIDVPKLKSHHKVGVTLALKGVVGLNCGRNWLPHRTQGTPSTGGDQFANSGYRQRFEAWGVQTFERASLRFPVVVPEIYRIAKRIGRKVFGESHNTIRGGGWHGNDTLWRMVLDINRVLLYADRSGRLEERPTKRRLCIIDGIVAGEGMGPVNADPLNCGVILAGQNPVAVDVVGAELMGFDYQRIPMLAEAFKPHALPLVQFGPERIATCSNVSGWSGSIEKLRHANPFHFSPPLGWDRHIERTVSIDPPRESSTAK